jgi:iron(III) transport system substrate-binding protein
LAFGLTNSSDAVQEIAAGGPLAIVYPDQAASEFGTLYIPMTVARLKNSPNDEPAAKLLDYLLSATVAKQLADGPRSYLPARTDVPASNRVKAPNEVHAMPADFPAAEAEWDATANTLGEMFAAP